jgi:hypothetical protein
MAHLPLVATDRVDILELVNQREALRSPPSEPDSHPDINSNPHDAEPTRKPFQRGRWAICSCCGRDVSGTTSALTRPRAQKLSDEHNKMADVGEIPL